MWYFLQGLDESWVEDVALSDQRVVGEAVGVLQQLRVDVHAVRLLEGAADLPTVLEKLILLKFYEECTRAMRVS